MYGTSRILTTRLVEECVLEVVHWYKFQILSQDVTEM